MLKKVHVVIKYVKKVYVDLLVCWILLCWIICMLNSSMLKNVQVEPPVQVEPNPSTLGALTINNSLAVIKGLRESVHSLWDVHKKSNFRPFSSFLLQLSAPL